jgi:hypothetical protein
MTNKQRFDLTSIGRYARPQVGAAHPAGGFDEDLLALEGLLSMHSQYDIVWM